MMEPVLLIPGLVADIRLFQHQISALSQSRPIMLALPRGATVEEMSSNLLAMAPPKFVLIGHGLGGDVALDIVRRALDRVSRIALISTDPLSETPQAAAARETRMVAARAGRLIQAIAEDYPATALAPGPRRAEVLETVRAMAETLGEGVYLSQQRAMQRRPDQQKTMRRATLPALILAGALDTLVPLRRHEFVAGLMPFAKLQLIADAGHLCPMEQPEAVTAALEAFLRGPMLLR